MPRDLNSLAKAYDREAAQRAIQVRTWRRSLKKVLGVLTIAGPFLVGLLLHAAGPANSSGIVILYVAIVIGYLSISEY
jgi:hypothetical protein